MNYAGRGTRMQKRKIRVGSRESKLAVVQSELVMGLIARAHPEIQLELVTMKTTGDRILDRPLDQVGGKGLFVKELDRALIDGRIDLSIHSLKDMPMEQPEGLPIVAYSKRADPRDVLVLPLGGRLDPQKPIGCSSARRRLQLAALYPKMSVESVRGNVLTRLAKLESGYAALVLAYAGLSRLGLENRISRIFTTDEMIPAAGQGILAIQGRAGEDYGFLDCVDDADSRRAALAERAFVRTLDGGCSSPVAAYARPEGEKLLLTGLYYEESTGRHIIETAKGSWNEPERLGRCLAERLRGTL